MPDDYNGRWKIDQAVFQGYVKAKLESLHEDVQEIKQRHVAELVELNQKIDKNVERINRTRYSAVGYGSAGAALIWLIDFVRKFL